MSETGMTLLSVLAALAFAGTAGGEIVRPDARRCLAVMKHVGIPSIAISPKNGRMWATWYGGKTPAEDTNNFVLLVTSADGGATWKEALVSDPDGEGPRRAFDPEVWVAPDGRLRWSWTDRLCIPKKPGAKSGWDSDSGDPRNDVVHVATLSAEDEPCGDPASIPVARVGQGVMMCKPTVLDNGDWLFPVALWQGEPSSRCFVTRDQGRTFSLVGGATIPKEQRRFDEHQVVQRKNGDLVCYTRADWCDPKTKKKCHPWTSVSHDRGRTWEKAEKANFEHCSSRIFVRRLKSGNWLLVKNGQLDQDIDDRNRLTAYLSRDEGRTWEGGLVLDDRDCVSYPDGDERADGTVVVCYDYGRTWDYEVSFAEFTEADVLAKGNVSGRMFLNRPITAHLRLQTEPQPDWEIALNRSRVVFDRMNGEPTRKPFRTGRPEWCMPFGAGNLSAMASFGSDAMEIHLSKADYLVPVRHWSKRGLASPGHLKLHFPGVTTNDFFVQAMDMLHGEVRAQVRTHAGHAEMSMSGDRETGALVIRVRDVRSGKPNCELEFDNDRVSLDRLATSITKVPGKAHWTVTDFDATSGRHYATVVKRVGEKPGSGWFRVLVVSEAADNAAVALDKAERALAKVEAKDAKRLEAERLAWWRDYWRKGWIRLEGDGRAAFLERCWYVNLYAMANVGCGPIPPKFNGGPGLVFDDHRDWGTGFWYQNTREMIWPMCVAGHPEFARSVLDMYDSFLPESKARTPDSFAPGGTWLFETTPIDRSYFACTNAARAYPDVKRPYSALTKERRAEALERRRKAPGGFTAHVFSSGTELLQQMFDYVRFTQDRSYLKTVATWLREQTELYLSLMEKGGDGRWHVLCSNVNESWFKVDDSIVDLAAARFCFAQTLAHGAEFGFPKELVADAKERLDNLAPLPTVGGYRKYPVWGVTVQDLEPGNRLWAPYAGFKNGDRKQNAEYNELYLVHPFAMAHDGAADTDELKARAIATYRHLPEAKAGGSGWTPVSVAAARLGLPEAADVVYSHARNTCRWPFGGGKSPAGPMYPGSPVEDAPYFDGTGVVMTGIQELLIQSHAEEPSPELFKGGELRLLRGVPKEWHGAFKLFARGGRAVEKRF